ncbi:twin-arginine translocase TatA/TatE family subunit [Halorubellus sp. PRR65]|uniref:Sec-independent protein translocase subunit TatA/TatB n=1 Tax=Halorubellus sp. PRR65 TaxID=3098148 RepID=UPI002B25F463|nr:twin-arginine translocase TatA/TatE family subunit [Halorubellus sp. PRR65]
MSFQLFIGGIGGPELAIVLMLAVLLFGANKLPKLARASGEAMGEFQKGRDEVEREIREATTLDAAEDAPANADADEHVDGDEYDVDADREVDTDRDAPSA